MNVDMMTKKRHRQQKKTELAPRQRTKHGISPPCTLDAASSYLVSSRSENDVSAAKFIVRWQSACSRRVEIHIDSSSPEGCHSQQTILGSALRFKKRAGADRIEGVRNLSILLKKCPLHLLLDKFRKRRCPLTAFVMPLL